jgi:hypothetical protein
VLVKNTPHLFISFWNICLDNLPEGSFTRRCISSEDAKYQIEKARATDTLVGLSDDDLLAPYRKQQRGNHEALCTMLNERFDISLSLKDFCTTSDQAGESIYTVNALSLAQVQNSDRLLVITCAYSFAAKGSVSLSPFKIEPTTIGFHIFEALP